MNKSTQLIAEKAADDASSTLPMCLSETETERQRLDAEYKVVRAKAIAEMQIDHLEPLTTEEEILAAAIEITKRK